jgi:toxin secretion/phage lysis holin
MDHINTIKAVITASLAAATALWGWFGWLIIAFIICLALDYLTGTIAAGKKGKWDSTTARAGIWHKLGSIVAVTAAGIADLVIGLILSGLPITLPFNYTVALCPVVVAWYILTELGSVVENAEKLGAPIPPFLRSVIAICKSGVEKAGDSINGREK